MSYHNISYCRAILVSALERFPEWTLSADAFRSEARPDSRDLGLDGATASEDGIVFLHEDGVVTAGPFRDSTVLFSRLTDTWREFCREHLQFELAERQTSAVGARYRPGR